LTLVALEPPVAWDRDAIRDEKVKVLQAVRAINPADVEEFSVRAQYSEGSVQGEKMQGYLGTQEVGEGSTTETYVAMNCSSTTGAGWRAITCGRAKRCPSA